MPLHVHSCIACEDVRPESDGKATIVGFMAVAPFPKLVIHGLAGTDERMCFMFALVGVGDYAVVLKLMDTDSAEVVFRSENWKVTLKDTELLNLILGPFTIDFPSYSTNYEMHLVGNEETIYRMPFRIEPTRGKTIN